MSLKIDPNRTFTVVEDAVADETNQLHRAYLDNILEHFRAEAVADVDRIIATLSPRAMYVFVGPSFTPPGQSQLVVAGFDAIREFYAALLANTMREMQYDVEEMRVDDHMIYQRGINRVAMNGASLAAQGHDVIDDPDVWYMQDIHAVTIFPFDENRLCLGEYVFEPTAPTTYFDAPLDLAEVGSITADLA